jgi:tetratricopeptide (TPR) repeat protein
MRLGTLAGFAALLSAGRVAHGQSSTGSSAADTTSYAWLIKAAGDAVDRGEFDQNADEREALYKKAEDYARRAIAANPNDAEGHFHLARAIGRRALTMGKRDQVKFAKVVYDEANAALRAQPKHAGALHVLGVWNEHIMQLNWIERTTAKTLLGGKVFGEASWENAQRDLEEAVAIEPNRITHRLDLARVYADRDQKAKAIEQLEWIGRAPATDPNDAHYKDEASALLRDLRR